MRSLAFTLIYASLIGCGAPNVSPAKLQVDGTSQRCDARVLFYSWHWGRDQTLDQGPKCLAPSSLPPGSSEKLVDALNDRRTVWRRATNTGDVVLLPGVNELQLEPARSSIGVSTEFVWIVLKSPDKWLWCVSFVAKNHCDSFDFVLTGQPMLGNGGGFDDQP